MKHQKGQVLLVVFMLLLFVSIMVGGAAFLWQSAVNTSALQKDSLRAFYIAQAGIERGRAEIGYHEDDDYGETFPTQTFGGGTYNLDIIAGTGGSKNTKEIVSTGRFGNSTREIYMRVAKDNSAPPGLAWGWHRKNGDEWREE
jgi:hypothetical protein